MRLDKFTIKAQEAFQAAQSLAEQQSHQAIEPEHLLTTLIEQREGILGPLLPSSGPIPTRSSEHSRPSSPSSPRSAAEAASISASARGRCSSGRRRRPYTSRTNTSRPSTS